MSIIYTKNNRYARLSGAWFYTMLYGPHRADRESFRVFWFCVLNAWCSLGIGGARWRLHNELFFVLAFQGSELHPFFVYLILFCFALCFVLFFG